MRRKTFSMGEDSWPSKGMGMFSQGASAFERVTELFLSRYALRPVPHEACMAFLLRYAVDPEMRCAISRKICQDKELAERREELGFVLALELVLEEKGRRLFQHIISEARIAELQAEYPEVFGKDFSQKNSKSFQELLEEACRLDTNQAGVVLWLSKAIDNIFPEGAETKAILDMIKRHAAILLLEKNWMRDLTAFQEALKEDVTKILNALGERPEIDEGQAKRVLSRSQEVELIFCVATQAIALRHYQALDEDEKKRIESSSEELSWDENSLKEGMERRLSWSEDASEAIRSMISAAEALRQYGEVEAALRLYSLLLERVDAETRLRAELHNRMAVIHREMSRWKEALLDFQQAGMLWEEAGAMYEEAVTSSLIAEAYGKLGKREKAMRYLEESFSHLEKAGANDERMARGYFYLAACSNGLGRLDLEKKALERGIEFAQRLEDSELFLEFNHRLMSLGS
ncbi:MAG: hypothetical protein QW520_01875 [Methanomassiliicoccales archaeon]